MIHPPKQRGPLGGKVDTGNPEGIQSRSLRRQAGRSLDSDQKVSREAEAARAKAEDY